MNPASLSLGCRKQSTSLFYSSENEFGNSTDSSTIPTSSVVERLRVNGVSVSPKGFHVLLESTTGGPKPETTESSKKESKEKEVQDTNKNEEREELQKRSSTVLPLKMTNDPADTYAATSPESLTLCQLLSGVDMAGAILPPELLGRIVACHIEDKIETLYDDDDDENPEPSIFVPVLTPIEGKIWQYLQAQQAMLREQNLFGQADPKKDTSSSSTPLAQMPQVTLDQLTLIPLPSDDESSSSWKCKLECALLEWKENIVVEIKADLLASLAYNYDPESSLLFTCVALALRYKAPIVLEQSKDLTSNSDTNWSSSDDLDRDFPQRTTLENLQEQSTRVTQNIEKGFEIHKLTGALQIAMRLGDTKAAEKIRAKLDEYDSMEDIPTLGSESSSDGDDRLDDLENNILQ